MNNLFADIGYKSINHEGEQLCGDHIEVVDYNENSTVIVLADGLGSGVKASILSTLTSKIISTMLAAGLSIDECVSTIAATLPVCSKRQVAYSTFTIMQIIENHTIELIQYDNPQVIMLRDFKEFDYPKTETFIDGKKIYKSSIPLQENDIFIALSDGCPYAGADNLYNYNWGPKDIAAYMEVMSMNGLAAKNLATMLVDECNRLYENRPTDDTTACVIKIRKHNTVNLLFGPPTNPADEETMLSQFFSQEGKHVISGGTTASIAARYLGKAVEPLSFTDDSKIPPMSKIEGVDLVTEGIITLHKVGYYAKDYLSENNLYEEWFFRKNGAALISQLLFEEATDIHIYVGQAVNVAHQQTDSPIHYHLKISIIEELISHLTKMRKKVTVKYF